MFGVLSIQYRPTASSSDSRDLNIQVYNVTLSNFKIYGNNPTIEWTGIIMHNFYTYGY